MHDREDEEEHKEANRSNERIERGKNRNVDSAQHTQVN